MDVITIFQAISRWVIPALLGGGLFLGTLTAAYLVYKKIFHGQKKLTQLQLFSGVLLCGWGVLVLGLTSLSRGANFSGHINLDFLSGYISAWNNWSISELQLIVFNILMFAPLGFLLPLLWKRAEKFPVTLLISLGTTGALEVFQFITGTGIFELDDLFHNLLGSIFGYFCIMALLAFIREKKLPWLALGKAVLIPAAVGAVLGIAVWVYNSQPYGNMSILPAAEQDMIGVQVVKDWKFTGQQESAAVYRNQYGLDKEYIGQVKSGLEKLENLTFSRAVRREDENIGYTGTNKEGTSFQLLFFFRTGEWNYTTFAEKTKELTEDTAAALRLRYETWMKEYDLLPEDAEFTLQNGDTLRWDVTAPSDISEQSKDFQTGSVMIQFDETGALSSFIYQICWNEYLSNETIISPDVAYTQVEKGNFQQYLPFEPGDRLTVNSCKLEYLYDTKGFYQPVYEFSGYINDEENIWECNIPAMEK